MISPKMILEVCCGDIQSALNAAQGGAQRIELCTALEADGLTPSAGLIAEARKIPGLKLHVLIRPREGNFVYSDAEYRIMQSDIEQARNLGADGVVIGALTAEGDIDTVRLQSLVQSAQGLQITFHRAFDQCRDPHKALEQIIALGCHRLLTSGQCRTAAEGLPLLRTLAEQAHGRIVIMPGAGVNADNARQILDAVGTSEIHGSLRTEQDGRLVTDAVIVQRVMQTLA